MTDEPTCGKGLAAHAALPAALSRTAAAMAGVLEDHLRSVERDGAEHAAYTALTEEWRAVGGALKTLAGRMRGYRDLPIEPHDEAVLMTREAVDRFAAYVESERALLELLQSWVERDESMLAEMR
ncbi:MAG TPA: hypothetical protein VG106_04060 [Vicinamibacterales bacterium]|nr:hypothetical protein [Vicinamibacterales bacterium]